eukprot:6201596-Pleurochrysis_carterae.AAC.2
MDSNINSAHASSACSFCSSLHACVHRLQLGRAAAQCSLPPERQGQHSSDKSLPCALPPCQQV